MRAIKELDDYNYDFPPSLIAEGPARPRDAARIMMLDRKTGEIGHDIFRNLPDHIPAGTLLVLNETKVLPARIPLRRETGGKIKMLYLGGSGKDATGLSEKRLHSGETLFSGKRPVFRVLGKKEGEYILRLLLPRKELEAIMERTGEAPIPPYIKHPAPGRARLLRDYQSVFARKNGSAAAPTASLHFTNRLLQKLRGRGIKIARVTLHVGLGTFAPLTEENLERGRLHGEWYEIPAAAAAAIQKARREKRPIIAVGTTALRALEAWAETGRKNGVTDIFIRPGYRFRKIDGLITNFHVPRSSLLMLVSALAGKENIARAYREAVRRKYRLFSFGDGMLIL